jgi:outer membrane autotransporter protein
MGLLAAQFLPVGPSGNPLTTRSAGGLVLLVETDLSASETLEGDPHGPGPAPGIRAESLPLSNARWIDAMHASLSTRTLQSLLFAIAVAAAAAVPGGPVAAQSIWNTNVNANWNNNANWIGDFPDAIGADAFFNASPNADITITLTAPVTVGTIMIDNNTSSTITGQTITFNDNTAALIEFNGGGDWTISSNIQLDSDLTLTGDSDATIDGVIADGAATNLTKNGAGLIRFGAANTFTGSTIINDGILRLDAANALGSTSDITLNGDSILRNNSAGSVINDDASLILNGTSGFELNGDIEVIGSLAGGSNTTVDLGADTLQTGGNNASTTYSGVISGAGGSLVKNGTGTFSLNGDNTYTGPTTINNGRLNVNGSVTSAVTATSGSTLGGTGSVQSATINNNAIVDPGTALASIGTLTVDGNGVPAFTQLAGSTYEVDINDGGTIAGVNNDLIDLTSGVSTADLDGTVSVFDNTGGLGDNYEAGTTFTILRTANPAGVTGMYSGVTDNLFLRDALLIHNSDNVQMQLFRVDGDFEGKGTTRNQKNVGEVLDEETPFATGAFGDGLDDLVELALLNPAAVPAVLDTLGGEVHASVAGHMVQQSSRFVDMISRRMRTNSKGDVGMYGSTVQPGAPMLMGNATVDGLQRVSLTDAGEFTVRAQGVGSPAWGSAYGAGFPVSGQPLGSLWIGGYGVTGDVDGDGNGNPYDYDIFGTVFGIEQQVAPSLLLGLAGGYGRSQVDMSSPNSDADVDSYHVGLYGHFNEGIFYSTAVVAYGYQDYDTTRQIPFFGLTANGNYDGQQFVAYGEKGLNLCFAGMRVQPLVGLQYIALQRDAFTESGAGPFNLVVAEDHVNSLRLSAGGRIAPELPPGFFGAIIPEFRGRWVHELKDDDQTLSAAFAGGGNNFAVTSAELGRNFGVVGAGVTAQLSPMVNLYLDYDYTFSSSLEAHAGSGGLEFLW